MAPAAAWPGIASVGHFPHRHLPRHLDHHRRLQPARRALGRAAPPACPDGRQRRQLVRVDHPRQPAIPKGEVHL